MDIKEVSFLESQGIVIHDTIAQGGYGAIFYVFSTQYNMYFALKKIKKENFNQAEIECLKSLDDPLFVRLYNFYQFEDHVYLLMEYCPNDLHRLLEFKKTLTETELYQCVRGITIAVKALYDRKIAHCDIKPSNFMIDQYGRIKLGDFGLSSICYDHPTAHRTKGTRKFWVPEVANRLEYNPIIADMWSLGVTIYNLAFNSYPMFDKNNQLLLNESDMKMQIFRRRLDTRILNVISRCLDPNPRTRATAAELLNHPYFQRAIDDKKRRNSNFGAISKPLVQQKAKAFIPNLILKQKSFSPSRISSTFDLIDLTQTQPTI